MKIMKNILLAVLFFLPLFALGQTESNNVTHAYAEAGLDFEVVQEILVRVTGLEEDQAEEAMMPFLSVILGAKEAGGVAKMDEEMVQLFNETWGVTDVQILDLERVASRFAGAGSRRR